MTVNRSGNPARTNIPDYKPSRPVNDLPAKGTGWAGYGASSRQRTEAARSHVKQSFGTEWQQANQKVNKPSGRAGANTPGDGTKAKAPEDIRHPQVEAKRVKPAKEVFKRGVDSGQTSGTSKVTMTTRDEPLKTALPARTRANDIELPELPELPQIDTSEEEEVLPPSFAEKNPAPAPISPKAEILAAVQKLIDDKYGDTNSPVYVQGLVYKRMKDPYRIELTGLTIAKKSVSEKLAKQYGADKEGLRTALDALKSTETKTLELDVAGWKNTRLNAAFKKQGGDLKKLFTDMISASAKVRARHAPSLIDDAIKLLLKGDLTVEGIFRKTSNETNLEHMQCMLADVPDLKAALRTDTDPLALPALIKRMLKELPKTLISGPSKDDFLGLDEKSSKTAYETAIGNLSAENQKILGNLMRALNTVAKKENVELNKMNAGNLGKIFASVLMEEENDAFAELQRTTNFEPVVTYMIVHANNLVFDRKVTTSSPKRSTVGRNENIDGTDSIESTTTRVKNDPK